MHKIFGVRAASLIPLLATIGIAACSDATTGPANHKMVIQGRKDLTSYEYGSLVTVVDESGQTLTLDIAANEIQTDDGRVFILSPDQTAVFATDFENTIIYDALGKEIQTLADHQVCHDTGGCIGEMTRSTPIENSMFKPRFRGTSRGRNLNWRARPTGFGPSLPGGSRLDLSLPGYSTPAFDYFSMVPDCESMRRDMVMSMANYRDARAEANHRLLDQSLSLFALTNGRHILKLTVTAAEADAVAVGILAAAGADQAAKRTAETQMDFMRVVYTTQLCGTVDFNGASYSGFSYQSVNGRTLICHFEWWQVTFDGGQTSRSIGVNVCEFAME